MTQELDPTVPTPANVGGQAVLEGVMMRAPGSLAIVVRRKDGSLVLRERSMPVVTSGPLTWPFLRGMLTLVSSLRVGNQALRWSAEILEQDLLHEEEMAKAGANKGASKKVADGDPADGEPGANVTTASSISTTTAGKIAPVPPSLFTQIALAVGQVALLSGNEAPATGEPKKGNPLLTILPIAFAIGLFIFLPQAAAEGINAALKLGLDVQSAPYQAITGISKLIIVVSYLALIRLMPDVRRVFQYHGAEHKAISTYEARRPLVVEEARLTTALHARCGTTFIIMVAFVSVFVFSALGAILPPIGGGRLGQWLGFFLLKLPFLPVIAGITFELQRFFAKYCSTGPLRVLLWPGFLVQKITTAPPEDDQLEVALASLRSALANAKNPLPEAHPDQAYSSYAQLVLEPSYARVPFDAPPARA